MIKTIFRWLRRFGVNVSIIQASAYEHLIDAPRYSAMTVRLEGNEFKIADAPSFYHSYREIFINGIYNFRTASEQPVIVDCGSNCGVSVAYFKKIYSNAKITAVEADPVLFGLLCDNIKSGEYKDITILNKAVTNGSEPVSFHRDGSDGGRIQPIEDCSDVVQVAPVNLDELIDGKVDFLKMDIEGGEVDVLCASRKLKNVNQCFVEYHSFAGHPQKLGELLNTLKSAGFRYYIHHNFCSSAPLTIERLRAGQDMQLNIFCRRNA